MSERLKWVLVFVVAFFAAVLPWIGPYWEQSNAAPFAKEFTISEKDKLLADFEAKELVHRDAWEEDLVTHINLQLHQVKMAIGRGIDVDYYALTVCEYKLSSQCQHSLIEDISPLIRYSTRRPSVDWLEVWALLETTYKPKGFYVDMEEGRQNPNDKRFLFYWCKDDKPCDIDCEDKHPCEVTHVLREDSQ